jgi:hypothetical protein
MPRRSSRNPAPVEEEDDKDVLVEVKDEKPRQGKNKRTYQQQEEDDRVLFSSQAPEMTQEILPVRTGELNNLNSLPETAREKAISDLTRLALFRGLAGDAIDRTKCIKEAAIADKRISTAAFEEVNKRLHNIFSFELRRMPLWMEKCKSFPSKFKDRYYLINTISEDTAGLHSKGIHSVHADASIEKGFLMVVLALAYCKGEPRNDGSRWILETDLYALLHRTDENIPSAPPTAKRRTQSTQVSNSEDGGGVAMTPDVDVLLNTFVQRDYLVSAKLAPLDQNTQSDEAVVWYTMGPRAAMEIGRKQILYFCAEILDQEPDPTMLLELQQDAAADEDFME